MGGRGPAAILSFNIPPAIEPEIVKYARTKRITTNEAIVRLVEAGLNANRADAQDSNAILSGLGMFSDAEDAAILDAAVAIAYEERHRPSKKFS
jgi:hypothetical protein